MNTPRSEIEGTVLDALASVAPEMDASQLDARLPLREELDLDSMDFLNFVTALHSKLGIDVPERDYPKLATLDSCVDYLLAKRAG